MANKITSETVLNPSGVFDISSCIVTETKSDLIISDCMSQITKYVFQFWIRSENYNYNIIFNCDTTSKVIAVTPEWQYFFIVFDVENISNIILTFPKGKFYVYNTKLEIGSQPTDWSPHPEDGNQLYRELNGKVEQMLIQNTSTIDRMTNLVDKVNMTIENSMSRTEYQTSINGILSSIDEDMENLKDGENKWYVTIYNKADFNKLTKLPDEETDWSDIDNPNQSDDEPDDPSPTEEPDDIDTLEADDRDRYDMKIFMLENGDLNPVDEYAVDDNNIAMRIDGKGRVIYYYTFVKFGKDYKATLSCSFRKATCYLNGTQLISESIIDTMDVIFDFKAGWNLIEIISNEGNFSFKNPISKMAECLRMNYAVAVPTSRNVKMQVKGSGIYQNLDRILSEVYKYEIEYYTDSNGQRKSRKVMKQSRIKQTADMIQLLVKDIFGNYSEFTLTPQFIQAITQQFIVTDPITGERVIIQNGQIQANSIDSTLLSTDAIRSRNFDGGVVKQREAIDPDTGETVMEDYIDLDDIDFDPEKNRIFPAHGTFLDLANGNYYSPSLVVINEYKKQVEDEEATGGVRVIDVTNKAYFKGDVYADTFTTNSGNIGPWHITDTALYRGIDALGQRDITSQDRSYNAYMGDLGFSISDAIVYDANTNSLTLRPNSLELSAPDVQAITFQAVNGNTIYYRQSGVPVAGNNPNEPAMYWNEGEYSSHLDELCYRIDTGELYRFEKLKNSQGNSVLYVINFNSNSKLRVGSSSPIDYVEIYYVYNKKTYRVATRLASQNSFQNAPIIIPTDDFYVYLHIEDYASSGLIDYYGFKIDSVTTTTGTATATVSIVDSEKRQTINTEDAEHSGNVTLAINSNLPYCSMERLETGIFPQTTHPYAQKSFDKVWHVKSGISSLESYQWVKIENAELIEAAANARKALSFMHYDATNGLIFHNGVAKNMPNDTWTVNDLQKLDGGNARLTTSGMDIYNGNTLLAHYGNTTEFYKYTNGNKYTAATLGANGFSIYDGTISLGTLTSLNFGNTNQKGLYINNNGLFTVGNKQSYIKYDGENIIINASSISFGDDSQEIMTVINDLQSQVDDNSVSLDHNMRFHGNGVPTNSNYPEEDWQTGADKDKYVGSLYYDLLTGKKYYYLKTDNLQLNFTLSVQEGNISGDYIGIFYDLDGVTYSKRINVSDIANSDKSAIVGSTRFKVVYYSSYSTTSSHKCTIMMREEKTKNNAFETTDLEFPSDVIFDGQSNYTIALSGSYLNNDLNGNTRYRIYDTIDDDIYEWIELQDEDIATANTNATNALNLANQVDANNYFFMSTYGLAVTPVRIRNVNQLNELLAPYVNLTNSALQIIQDGHMIASYGETTTFYNSSGTVSATLGSNGFSISNGNAGGIHIINDRIYSGSHLNINDTANGFCFLDDGSISIGNSSNYIKFVNGNLSISIGNQDINAVLSEASNAGKTATNYLFESNGLIVAPNANYSSSSYLHIGSSSIDIYSNGNKAVTYGTNIQFFSKGSIDFLEYYPDLNVSEELLWIDSNGINFANNYNINIDGIYYGNDLILNRLTSTVTCRSVSMYLNTTNTSEVLSLSASNGLSYTNGAYYRMTGFHLSNSLYGNGTSGELSCTTLYADNIYYNNVVEKLEGEDLSDERFKNIVNYDNDKYKQLFMSINPIEFTWIDSHDEDIHIGVGAQTILYSLNKLQIENSSFVKYSGVIDRYSVNYKELMFMSIPIVQEHELEIQSLKSEIESLKGEIKRLREKVK